MSRPKDHPEYITAKFCNERTRRIEERIENMRDDIIKAINDRNPPMSWQAKATIIASITMSVASIIVAYIQFIG